MIGAIIGDIVGSRFEWNNIKNKEFELLNYKCFFTDDSIMSLAIAKAVLECKSDYTDLSKKAVYWMQKIGRKYPNCGYGGNFHDWIYSDNPSPYNSYGNGAAMRVSACGLAAKSIEEAIILSRKVTEISHNHPEGIKGAEATTVAIYLAKSGVNILDIRDYINDNYYPMNFKLDDIRDSYQFNETCQETVPQAIEAFLESNNFEDAIRNAISIGGDSDTLAAITGSIAEAYYGVPTGIRKHALTFLNEELLTILIEFENEYESAMEKDGLKIKTKKKIIEKGERTVINYYDGKCSGTTDNLVFTCKKNVLTKYAYLYLWRDLEILQKGFKGSGLQHISKDYVESITIKVPTIDIQSKIIQISTQSDKSKFCLMKANKNIKNQCQKGGLLHVNI